MGASGGSDSAAATPPPPQPQQQQQCESRASSSSLMRSVAAPAVGGGAIGDREDDADVAVALSELPLLWAAIESSEAASAAMRRCGESHALLVEETAGLLWGGAYPAWVERQWMRYGDGDDVTGSEGRDVSVAAGTAVEAPPSPSWSRMMQQAFDALHIHLPLHHGGGGVAREDVHQPSPVTSLATHLVQDAPLLWLRCFLVPMYTQWAQHRAAASPAVSVAERDGGATMHELLAALGTASMTEAVRKELAWSEDGAATAQQQQQQQHLAELLYFAGELARAAQSFAVLGHGGVTILAAAAVRLLSHARAAWAEWAGHHTVTEVHHVAQRVCHGGADAAEGVMPADKRARVETARQPAAESLAALRAGLAEAARRLARVVWRCWLVLYGCYGADLYTSEAAVRAAEEAEVETAGVSRMAAPQQAHWRRLRLAAEVKQHALSEPHWLWCGALLAAVEDTLLSALRDARLAVQPAAPAHAARRVHLDVLDDTVHAFTAELRGALHTYGAASLAIRSGALHSSTSANPATLHTALHNVTALQDIFDRCVTDDVRRGPSASPASATRRTAAGAYLWQLHPMLLRAQVPEEALWMCNACGEQAADSDGGGDAAEATAASFKEERQRHWRRRGVHLMTAVADGAHCVEAALTQRRRSAASVVSDDVSVTCGLLADVVGTAAADGGGGGTSVGRPAMLCDVAAEFESVFDESCFFALRAERQRLLTHAVQRLHSLLAEGLPRPHEHPLASLLRRDTRLWMLLTHAVLLQLERRGRIAREDEVLLPAHLLPLMGLLSADPPPSSPRTADGDSAAAAAAAVVVRDVLLLLSSNLASLPWDVAQLSDVVCRHLELCAAHGQRLDLDEATTDLMRVSGGTTAPSPPPPSSAPADDAEERLAVALARHANVAAEHLSAAPCGLLVVVGAYRSCGRALHSLRAALAEQHRMAREDDVGEFIGRAATYCGTADVAAFRGLVTTVHHCVFGYTCRPRGLLRLWLGYLQHLFCCVVPPSSAGDATSSAGEATLVLMPSSWQRQQRVTTLWGARVHRTGWRAVQHDGEPDSQTRLREALGECMADLLLLPYAQPREAAPTAAATATRAILQRTLPHAVLEILCELLQLPVTGAAVDDTEAQARAVCASFLSLAGLLAFLRRLELHVVPGSWQDPRLAHLLRCVYTAADAAAVGL